MSVDVEKCKKEFHEFYERIFEETFKIFEILNQKKSVSYQQIVNKINSIFKMVKESEILHISLIENKIHDDDIAEKVLEIAMVVKTHKEVLQRLKKINIPTPSFPEQKNDIN